VFGDSNHTLTPIAASLIHRQSHDAGSPEKWSQSVSVRGLDVMKKRICRQPPQRLEYRFLHQGCVFLPHPFQVLPFVSGRCPCAPSALAMGSLSPPWGTCLGLPWWARSCPVAPLAYATRPHGYQRKLSQQIFSNPVFHLPRSLDSRLVFGLHIVHNRQEEAQVGSITSISSLSSSFAPWLSSA
jgi:hypothetical protein